jgi:hypothetical protein
MIGALIGAGLSAVSSIAGNIAANKRNAEARRLMREQLRENQAWRDKEYYADPTKRGDTIRLMTQTGDLLRARTQNARGTQAMMGGTEDSIANTMQANNETIANATGNLVAANEARKDRVDTQYRTERGRIMGQQIADKMQQAGTIADTVKQVGAVASNIANGLDSVQGKAQAAGDENTSGTPVDTGKATEDYLMKQYGAGDLFNRKGGVSV